MRINNQNAESYIYRLASSIGKDPASLENWRCLHIEAAENTVVEDYADILRKLKDIHKDLDCDIVHCADNDVFFISRSLHADQLYEIADELVNTASIQQKKCGTATLYDLFRDWHNIREILLRKAGSPPIQEAIESQYNFGEEAASLQGIFLEAKNLRRVRLPLHVMVVDDDALTRRLVANIFKTEYALITAANAQEAVSNYLLHAPDIVFLDIGLPDASGFDVLHQIMDCDPEAYVIMFSGNSYLDNVNLALSAGACGFVAKPFKKDKMRHYIEDSALHHRKSTA